MALLIVALVAWNQRDAVRSAYDSVTKHAASPTERHAPTVARGDESSNIVHLQSRPGLNVPVKVVTKWWATGSFGRVTVYVPVGETPRKALTVALAQRGYQVLG